MSIHNERKKKTPEEIRLCSWFLGPKAENGDILEWLILEALRDVVFWRRNFHPDDASLITESEKDSDAFEDTIATLQEKFTELLAQLKQDIPFYSPRYIGHMLGDQLLSATAGYFAAMLHNPNNVTFEASPMTTKHEVEVGEQLARLMGYPEEQAWGHITSGGTIANFEALWVARNLKFLPLALTQAAAELDVASPSYDRCVEQAVKDLKERSVPSNTAPEKLLEISLHDPDQWTLLNLHPDDVLWLRSFLIEFCSYKPPTTLKTVAAKEVDNIISRYSLAGLGFQRFASFHELKTPGVIIAPMTAHYSLLKVAEALGLGTGEDQLKRIPVDKDFRIDLDKLESTLNDCRKKKIPVIALVSVLGTTEEGSVDYLHEIIKIRKKFRGKGLTFYLHCDAAWGGYIRTLFFKDDDTPVEDRDLDSIEKITNKTWPPRDVFKSFQSVQETDSATIDPHKLGYVPYPCGAAVFRNRRAREVISYNAPYIFHAEEQRREIQIPFIGQYILEGSKPGAAAAACWLAHQIVPLNQSGYGQIIGRSIRSAQELYDKCSRYLADRLRDSGILLVSLTRPPDTNIYCFMVNREGNPNLAAMNRLNLTIYEEFRFDYGMVMKQQDFIISKTTFEYELYGQPTSTNGKSCMDDYLLEARIAPEEFKRVGEVVVLRCTVMNPWLAEKSETEQNAIEESAAEESITSGYISDFATTLEKKIIQALTPSSSAVVQAFRTQNLCVEDSYSVDHDRSWTGDRAPKTYREGSRFLIRKDERSYAGKVFAYDSREDLVEMRDHFTKNSMMPRPHVYEQETTLVHLSGDLPQEEAKKYKKVFEETMDSHRKYGF